MYKKLVLLVALLVFAGCGGDSLRSHDSVLDGIEKNQRLSSGQKEFAKGYYRMRLMLAKDYPADQLEQMDVFVRPATYETWGLGPKEKYSAAEKIYLMGLDQLPKVWQMYSTVDMNALTPAERSFLSQMHSQYGPEPINLKQKMAEGQGTLHPDQLRSIEAIELLIGHEEFEDKDIVFYYRFLGGSRG